MQAPLKDKNDIKIFILYLMKNVGYPLDFANINDIVVQDGLVNYFDFAECFAELLDTGNIIEIKPETQNAAKPPEANSPVSESFSSCSDSTSGRDCACVQASQPSQPQSQPQTEPALALYSITEQGRQVAQSLQSSLMMMIREKSLRSAMRLLSFKKRGAQVKYSFSERRGDAGSGNGSESKGEGKGRGKGGGGEVNGYDFRCTIIEAKTEIMNMTFFVENKKLLDRIIWNFDNKPETVYRGILAVLSGEINYLIN